MTKAGSWLVISFEIRMMMYSSYSFTATGGPIAGMNGSGVILNGSYLSECIPDTPPFQAVLLPRRKRLYRMPETASRLQIVIVVPCHRLMHRDTGVVGYGLVVVTR